MRFRRRPPREPAPPPPGDATAETVVQESGAVPVVEETEYVPPPRGPRPPLLWPWLLLLGLLVLGGILAAILLTRDDDKPKRATGGGARVAVPNVVGRDAAAAATRLNSAGLKPSLKSRESTKRAGTVVAQRPRGGRRVPKGSVVTVFVSHLATVRVANVVGLTKSSAVARLKGQGLTSRLAAVRSTRPANVVVAQDPAAGADIAKGSTVLLNVSRGVASVPDVVGDSAPTAKQTLKAAGFVPVQASVASDESKNTVVAQDPRAGRRIPKGSSVRINVSNGRGGATTTTGTTTGATTTAPSTVRVPDVRGIDQVPAQRRVRAAGLKPLVSYVSSSEPEGRVVAQSPAAGSSVRRESFVRLSVSTGPSPRPLRLVPDVVGQDEATATQTLEGATFRVQSLPIDATDPSEDGVVLDQQPRGGSRAPQGALITIWVGVFAG